MLFLSNKKKLNNSIHRESYSGGQNIKEPIACELETQAENYTSCYTEGKVVVGSMRKPEKMPCCHTVALMCQGFAKKLLS